MKIDVRERGWGPACISGRPILLSTMPGRAATFPSCLSAGRNPPPAALPLPPPFPDVWLTYVLSSSNSNVFSASFIYTWPTEKKERKKQRKKEIRKKALKADLFSFTWRQSKHRASDLPLCLSVCACMHIEHREISLSIYLYLSIWLFAGKSTWWSLRGVSVDIEALPVHAQRPTLQRLRLHTYSRGTLFFRKTTEREKAKKERRRRKREEKERHWMIDTMNECQR